MNFSDEGTPFTKVFSAEDGGILLYPVQFYVIRDFSVQEDTNILLTYQSIFEYSRVLLDLFKITSYGIDGYPSYVNFTISEFSVEDASLTPIISLLTPNISFTRSNFSITFSLTITNRNGYIYVGIGNAKYKAPNYNQLRQGFDGWGQDLDCYDFRKASNNVTEMYNISYYDLISDIDYQLYYYASGDDPSVFSPVSPMYNYSFRSLKRNYANWGNVLWASFLIFISFLSLL